MKRNFICYATGLILNVLLLSIAFSSCTKKSSDLKEAPLQEEFASAAASKPGSTSSEVRLKLTVNDAPGNNITSDEGGDYVDGTQNTSIYFSTSGNLQFSTASLSNPHTLTVRWMNANFGSPLSGSAARGIEKCNFMSSMTGSGPDATPIQNLAIGSTKCITLAVGLMTISGGVLNFHNRNEDNSSTKTSYVYVTRTSATTWLMESAPPLGFTGCSGISNVGALRISTVWSGNFNMPFSFIFTAK